MNRIEHACRTFTAFTVFAISQTAAFGQTPCACEKNSSAAILAAQIYPVPQHEASVMTRLPDSWPRQWSDHAPSSAASIGTSTATVLPVSASPIDHWPTLASADGSYITTHVSLKSENTATNPRTSKRVATDPATSKNAKSDPPKSATPFGSPAFGAAFGGGGGSSGGGMSGGGGSGGFAAGPVWTPPASGSSGVDGLGSGESSTDGFLNTSRSAAGSSTGTDRSLDPAPDSTATDDPTPKTGKDCGLAEIPPPICDPPSFVPEIPSTGGNPISIPDGIHGNGVGETPVVPEPSSIVLLAMAIGVGGACYIRRRKRLFAASSVSAGMDAAGSLTDCRC